MAINSLKEMTLSRMSSFTRLLPRETIPESLRSTGKGQIVDFDVVKGQKDVEASNVTGPGEISVQGSHHY